MLKDITLGQYFPGASLLHRIDPRMKIILTVVYIVVVFLAKSVVSFALLIAFTAALILISRIPAKIILRGLRPLLLIISFTAVINIFWTKGDNLLVKFGFIEIYAEGLLFAALMIVRITALLSGTSVILTYTTSPIALTDGLERLLSPLMMTIALRFIPTLIEETEKIMNAQKARGADFTAGKLMDRARSLIPVLIPLFVSAFRRADELAVAMECRCYRGGEGRTRMNVPKWHVRDFITLAAFVLVGAGILVINRYAPGFSL